jgi:hypothetical protein
MRAGLTATGILAVLPLDIYLSTQLLPETIMTSMLGVSAWCFYCGVNKANSNNKIMLWMMCSGMALWFAYSAKIIGLLLGPLLWVYAIQKCLPGHRLARAMIWFTAGLSIFMIPEYVFYYVKKGDLMFPFHTISMGVYAKDPSVLAIEKDLYYRLVKAYLSMTIIPSIQFGITFFCIYISVLWSLTEWRKNLILLLWFAGFLLYINFGSAVMTRYAPLPAVARYLHPVVLPGVILLGVALSKMTQVSLQATFCPPGNKVLRILGTVTLAAIVVSSLMFSMYGLRRSKLELSAIEIRQLSRIIPQLEQKKFYVNAQDFNVLSLLVQDRFASSLAEYPNSDHGTACDYINHLDPGAYLIYDWRFIYDDWIVPADLRAVLTQLYSNNALIPVWHYRDRPGEWFYQLLKTPFFFNQIGTQERQEFLNSDEETSGIYIYKINDDFVKRCGGS